MGRDLEHRVLFVAGAIVIVIMMLPVMSMRVEASEFVKLTLVSDSQVRVLELGSFSVPVGVHPRWPSIPGATWVWATLDGNNLVDQLDEFGPFTFVVGFDLPVGSVCTGGLMITADNAYELFVNGDVVGSDGSFTRAPYLAFDNWSTIERFDISNLLRDGSNEISIRAINYERESAPGGRYWGVDPVSNPAGVLFQVEVECGRSVSVDVKPGSFPNSISVLNRGTIPVAILSVADFDAPRLVDRSSLTFGRTGEENSLSRCRNNSEDVNADGLPDLVCHFDAQAAGFHVGDTVGVLRGRTLDGVLIIGIDSVRILT